MATLPPAYTKRFWSVSPTAGGFTTGPGPAAGKRWVVRDVIALNANGAPVAASGVFKLTSSDGYLIFGVPFLMAVSEYQYQWVGRYVIDYPNTLELWVQSGNYWQVTVHGYELSV